MKSIIMFLFVIGVVMVVSGYHNQKQKCPPPKIVYKYIPRTFQEEQEDPAKVSEIFDKMFNESSPWINQLGDVKIKKNEVSQFLQS